MLCRFICELFRKRRQSGSFLGQYLEANLFKVFDTSFSKQSKSVLTVPSDRYNQMLTTWSWMGAGVVIFWHPFHNSTFLPLHWTFGGSTRWISSSRRLHCSSIGRPWARYRGERWRWPCVENPISLKLEHFQFVARHANRTNIKVDLTKHQCSVHVTC